MQISSSLIRAVNAPDLPALVELWLEKSILFAQADRRVKVSADARVRWLAQAEIWLQDERCGFFAAERDEKIIGYIIGWQQPAPPLFDAPYIGAVTDMAIDAHGYHPGAGRALVSSLKNWFEGRDVRQMLVYAPRRYAAEQAFWRSLGATEWMDVLWLKS